MNQRAALHLRQRADCAEARGPTMFFFGWFTMAFEGMEISIQSVEVVPATSSFTTSMEESYHLCKLPESGLTKMCNAYESSL